MFQPEKILMIDNETTGSLEAPLAYDFGCAVTTRKGKILEEINAIIMEVFYGMADLMQTAYYAEKLPSYRDEIWNGTREVIELLELRKRVHTLIKKYNIRIVCAHNARFDINALNNTIKVVTGDKIKYFFPYGIEVWDTLKMANQVFLRMPTYCTYCKDNGYMTKHIKPRPRLTAEIIYKYITLNPSFEEAHTGLNDAKIEIQILAYLFKTHKKMNKILYHAKA